MEFLDYMKTKKRMCMYYNYNVNACPLYIAAGNRCICETFEWRNPEKAERIVQEWADKHLITNADKFREVFGTIIKADNDNDESKCFHNRCRCRIAGENDVARWLNTEYKEPEVKADEEK